MPANLRAAHDANDETLERMTNHFHLLLRSEAGNLSAGMQFLSGRFTRLVNLRVGRDGPLFRGRYASVLIASDAQLVQTCRYIHLNPVARLTGKPKFMLCSERRFDT